MHTYIHPCIHTYIRTYLHTYIHTYIHTCMHACMHAYIHLPTYLPACLPTYLPAYLPTYYIPTNLRTHIHRHIYINKENMYVFYLHAHILIVWIVPLRATGMGVGPRLDTRSVVFMDVGKDCAQSSAQPRILHPAKLPCLGKPRISKFVVSIGNFRFVDASVPILAAHAATCPQY